MFFSFQHDCEAHGRGEDPIHGQLWAQILRHGLGQLEDAERGQEGALAGTDVHKEHHQDQISATLVLWKEQIQRTTNRLLFNLLHYEYIIFNFCLQFISNFSRNWKYPELI